MIRLILLAASVVIFALLAFQVIDVDQFYWQNGALALGFASMGPWDDIRL